MDDGPACDREGQTEPLVGAAGIRLGAGEGLIPRTRAAVLQQLQDSARLSGGWSHIAKQLCSRTRQGRLHCCNLSQPYCVSHCAHGLYITSDDVPRAHGDVMPTCLSAEVPREPAALRPLLCLLSPLPLSWEPPLEPLSVPARASQRPPWSCCIVSDGLEVPAPASCSLWEFAQRVQIWEGDRRGLCTWGRSLVLVTMFAAQAMILHTNRDSLLLRSVLSLLCCHLAITPPPVYVEWKWWEQESLPCS